MKFLLSLLACLSLSGANVTVLWDPNPEPDISHYTVYVGTISGAYTSSFQTPSTTFTVTNLAAGTTYYFAVTAVNTANQESDYSEEVSWRARPSPPKNLVITQETVEWRYRTNKLSPLTITPSAVVKIDDGTVVTGTVTSPGGSINRNVTAINGEAVLQGRAFTGESAEVSVLITKVTQPLDLTFAETWP